MTFIDRIKNHPAIATLVSVGAVVAFLVGVLPYLTGEPDLPSLVKSFSTAELNREKGPGNDEVEIKSKKLSATTPDKTPKTTPIAAPIVKENTDPGMKPDDIKPTVLGDGGSSRPVEQDKGIKKKQQETSKIRLSVNFTYPCSGNIDQFPGVSLSHVRVMPTTNSPSQPPVEGGATVKINKSIFRDNKNWYEIIYVNNGQQINGWLPTSYVIPSSDCKKK